MTRREIIEDVKTLKEKTKVLEEKVEKNVERIYTHVHPTPYGYTGTATTATNTALSTYTFCT